MPQRTNDFQDLITIIYKQIVEPSGTVTPSKMVYDRDAKTVREVDILIEHRIAHHTYRTAVECRDRSRKDSVEWIDALIGKAKSIDVDKVVAVSRQGFTKTAAHKAKAHGIDVLSIEEALETDWQRYPIRPGITLVTELFYRLIDVFYHNGEEYKSLQASNLLLEKVIDGTQDRGTVKEVFEAYFHASLLPELQKQVEAKSLQLCRTREDLTKTVQIEKDTEFPGYTIRSSSGECIDISKIKFRVDGTRRCAEMDQKHMQFNEMMVSSGQYQDTDLAYQSTVVQDPEANKIHLCMKIEKQSSLDDSKKK